MKIWVPGIPRPKGSFKWIRGKTRPSSEYVEKWQAGIQWIAQAEWDADPAPAPAAFGVWAKFIMPPPGRVAKLWPFPTKVPDGDKLLRAVFDALTGIVYIDDAQVVEWGGRKVFVETADQVGAEIIVWRIDESGLRVQEPRID